MQAGIEPQAFDRFSVRIEVSVRPVVYEDLKGLEWYGMFTHHREIIHAAYKRHLEGTNVMLIADVNNAPVGQVWLDLEKKAAERIGVLWAVRVFPSFQNMRIGTRLLEIAELVLRQGGYNVAELGVEKHNARAKRFYERNGYDVVGEQADSYSYTIPGAWREEVHTDEWLMQKPLTPRAVGESFYLREFKAGTQRTSN